MPPSRCRFRKVGFLWILAALAILFISIIHPVLAVPTDSFYGKGGKIYDSWFVLRTEAFGENGFFGSSDSEINATIVYESMGNYTGTASEIGKEFTEKYPDKHHRAKKIFQFVRDNVRYTHDSDLFGYKEFAQNADELSERIEKGKGYGDCEDFAILLSVLYKSAGFKSAIVVAPGHAATLVHLPAYKKANYFWEYKNESDWIWAEATGRENQLGWTPEKFIGKEVLIRMLDTPKEIEFKRPEGIKEVEIKAGEPPIHHRSFPFLSIIGLMWILPMIIKAFRFK